MSIARVLSSSPQAKEKDALKVDFDINSDVKNQKVEFGSSDLREFYTQSLSAIQDIQKDIQGL